MSRYAKLISLDELKAKVEPLVESDEFPYELPSQIEKDLSKVNFDFENTNFIDGYEGYPCGWEVLPNGLPVLFVNAGGDWEQPICFILYWDGKKIRGYIPEDGNIFNKEQRCAYGSEDNDEEEIDFENLPKVDPTAIRNDIMRRIVILNNDL